MLIKLILNTVKLLMKKKSYILIGIIMPAFIVVFFSFEFGTEYKYNETEKCIYRAKFKVASNVQYFSVTNSTKTVDNFQKNILSVKIIVGDSTQNLINQKIDYVLRYW